MRLRLTCQSLKRRGPWYGIPRNCKEETRYYFSEEKNLTGNFIESLIWNMRLKVMTYLEGANVG